MDINIDQATPRNDLHLTDDGRYFHKTGPDNLDIDKFNRRFTQYEIRRHNEMNRILQDKLNDLNRPQEELPIYNRPLGQILIETKDNIFNIFDESLSGNISIDTFTGFNRLFYIGICILFIAFLIFVFNFILLNFD